MNLFKRAMIYITRKKTRSILLFLILLVTATFLLIGLAIRGSADAAARQMRETLGSSFQLNQLIDNNDPSLWTTVTGVDGYPARIYKYPIRFDDEMVSQVMSAGDIKDYNAMNSTDLYTNLKLKPGSCTDLVKKMQSDPEWLAHLLSTSPYAMDEEIEFCSTVNLLGNTKSELNPSFQNGAFKLVQGKPIGPHDQWKALISEDLAQRNSLKVGDTFTGNFTELDADRLSPWTPGLKPAGPYIFEVAGIYKINFVQPDSELTAEFNMPENFVFIDMSSIRQIIMDQMGDNRNKYAYSELSFFVADPQNLDNVLQKLRAVDLPWKYLAVNKDDAAYKAVVKPLDSITLFTSWLVIAMAVGSMLILYLLLAMWVKSRRQEIGILRSIGLRKAKITLQLLLECAMIAAAAFLCSVFISAPIANQAGKAVENLLFSSQTAERFQVVQDYVNMWQAEPVASTPPALSYAVNPGDILFVLVLEAGIVSVAAGLSSIAILRQNPRDNLLN